MENRSKGRVNGNRVCLRDGVCEWTLSSTENDQLELLRDREYVYGFRIGKMNSLNFLLNRAAVNVGVTGCT